MKQINDEIMANKALERGSINKEIINSLKAMVNCRTICINQSDERN